MSVDGFIPYGYGLVITHRACSEILPVDSEGKFEVYQGVVPSPGTQFYYEGSIRTTSEGVRLIVFRHGLAPMALLWSLHPEPLEWYREQVEHVCNDTRDAYNMIEEVTAWM